MKDGLRVSEVSDLWLGLNVLAEQPLLIEGVAGLPCDGIYGSLVDLLLDCTQQQEERLPHCLLKNVSSGVKNQSCGTLSVSFLCRTSLFSLLTLR